MIAVGGDGTVNIVISALARHGLLPHIPLGVMPYGTGNNLVRSFGLERDSEKALVTIRQGYTTRLDISLVNQAVLWRQCELWVVSVPPGTSCHQFAALAIPTKPYATLAFSPGRMRIRYTDAAGHTVTLPSQRYIVGAMLNTSHYGSILRMAPDVVSDDGLFDVKLIRATPRVLYPLVFTIILTGQYDLSRHTTTLRATHVELLPETMCGVEMDGDVIPSRQRYCIQIAGHVRLLVPAPHERDERSYGVS